MGAQNQNATGRPASAAPSNVPPPTRGAVNCSASGALAAAGAVLVAGAVSDGPLAEGALAGDALSAGAPVGGATVGMGAASPSSPPHAARAVATISATIARRRRAGGAMSRPYRRSLLIAMRTRTLLLLSVACGLAILVAGLVLLLRIDTTEAPERLRLGDTARAGDLSVTVLGAAEDDEFLRVEVRLGGVDDDAVRDDFRLVVPGELVEPISAARAEELGGVTPCSAATVEPITCELVFGVADAQGTARSLLLRRGEDQHRWDLATPG